MGRFSVCPSVHLSVRPSIRPSVRPSVHQPIHPPLKGSKASHTGLDPASQASESARQASESASQASEALRPDWLGLRSAWQALGPWREGKGRTDRWMDGWTDRRTDGRMDGQTENLPILQDFVLYWGCCPATAQPYPKNCIKWGKGTADLMMPLGAW